MCNPVGDVRGGVAVALIVRLARPGEVLSGIPPQRARGSRGDRYSDRPTLESARPATRSRRVRYPHRSVAGIGRHLRHRSGCSTGQIAMGRSRNTIACGRDSARSADSNGRHPLSSSSSYHLRLGNPIVQRPRSDLVIGNVTHSRSEYAKGIQRVVRCPTPPALGDAVRNANWGHCSSLADFCKLRTWLNESV